MKFGLMWEKAKEMGCNYIATGHYAKTEYSDEYKKIVLKKSNAGKKDQSYVLWNIPKDLVEHIVFPLSDFESKDEIRKIARENNLKVANKPDSEDICFIPDGNYKKFLEKREDDLRYLSTQAGVHRDDIIIKINGKKLYEYARKNEKIELEPRHIEIYKMDLINIIKDTIIFKVQCSKGTYIRSLCEDIAKKLNTVGYMQDLERSRVGKFDIKDSITIEELEQNIEDSEFINQHFITIENYFKDKESIKLNEKRLSLFLNGVKLTHNLTDDMYKIYDENNKFVGIGSVKNNLLKREIIVEN